MILNNQKHLFNIPADITFLNCSYMGPLPKHVTQAGIEALNKRSSPWQLKIGDWFDPGETLRKLFADVIHADKENIALIPSVSYGMAIAAKNITLTKGQKIIVLDQQYPSNIYAWRELATTSGAEILTLAKTPDQSWTDVILENINSTTGLVAVANCHWTDGSLIDLEQVSNAVKKVNAKLVIDASQSVGAYPLDINKIKPDFLITVGYKWLLGPYGLGYLYADSKYCETGKPIEFTWSNKKGSEDFTRLVEYTDIYKQGARRFDAGEYTNYTILQMAIASLTQVLNWGVTNIQETISVLTGEIEQRAQALGLETPKRVNRVGHMIGVRISADKISSISKTLADNQVYVSIRGNSIRVAPHLYNDVSDIERLFTHLK